MRRIRFFHRKSCRGSAVRDKRVRKLKMRILMEVKLVFHRPLSKWGLLLRLAVMDSKMAGRDFE